MRPVTGDLEPMFDRLMSPYQPRVRKVVYGHRRYRRVVIIAAALHGAGVTIGDTDQVWWTRGAVAPLICAG